MQNKIILSTGSLFYLPLAEIFSIAKRAGFDGLELIIDSDEALPDPERLKKLMDKCSLPILSIHSPLDNCDVFGDKAKNIVCGTIKIAESLHSSVAVFHPGRKNLKNYSTQLMREISRIKHKKLKVVIENMPRIESEEDRKPLYDPELIAKFFSHICLDTSHLATTKLSFKNKIKKILNKIEHVHLADSNLKKSNNGFLFDEHLAFKSGSLNLEWVIKKLERVGYSGYYCMELRPKMFEGLSNTKIIDDLSAILVKLKSPLNTK